ncbi:MAG TPA: hypothetical protein VG013_09060 [Gemmataceae bacterium]|nr:hypothetical protein [Gemmataceae bacterium]
MADSSWDRNPIDKLAHEFLARHRRGETPAITEYTDKYPDLADEIRDLFPALVTTEEPVQEVGDRAPAQDTAVSSQPAIPPAPDDLTDDAERPHIARCRKRRLRKTRRGLWLVAGTSVGMAALVLGTIGWFVARSPSANKSQDQEPTAFFRRTPQTQTEQGRARAAEYEAVWRELVAVMDEATQALERADDKASAQRLIVALRRNTERMQTAGQKLNDLGMSDQEMQQNMAGINRIYLPRLRQSLAKFREAGDAFRQRVRAGAIPTLEATQVATALLDFGRVLDQLSD